MSVNSREMNASKRKRSRKACCPCRDRKRKCDGDTPCATCVDWGYECYYEARKKNKIPPHSSHSQGVEQLTPEPRVPARQDPNTAEPDHGGLVRRLEANSSAAFVRKLALKIDPAKAPKLSLFGWNIGSRQLSSPVSTPSLLQIHEIASHDHLCALAEVYFDKVHPCYGFIERGSFFERLNVRWQSPMIPDLHDGVVAGIAALGCLFSQRSATITEVHLARAAQAILDAHQLVGPPPLHLLTGWTLRLVYLRLTGSPHATWVASSTLMHLLEAAGLHPESHSVLQSGMQCDAETQRRLVGVAQHLNIWTSFDLGLSRVSFPENDVPLAPAPRADDYTSEVLGLLPLAVTLDPAKTKNDVDLESTLSELLRRVHTQPPSVMAQSNVVLCVLRRMHTQNLGIPPGLVEPVLALLKKALGCATRLVVDCAPWHQIANVPFQIICVLLVIDSRSSLALLSEAMQTLKRVASAYDTDTMKETYSAAGLLLLLHQQRRKDDVATLDEALSMYQQGSQMEATPQSILGSEEFSWLGALVDDMPGLQRFDLDQFLNGDLMDGSGF